MVPNLKNSAGSVRIKNEEKILEAAKKEFVAHGFRGASIKSIAERAAIPRANIHYYFEDKTEIYKRLLDSILETWNSQYDTLVVENNPKEALTAYIKSKINYSKEDPDASRIFASEIIHGAPILSDYLSSDFKLWMQSKVEVIESWIQKGLMDKVDPHHLIFLLWSSTQHYADFNVQVLAGLDKEEMTDTDFDSVIESLTSIILKGCGIR